MFGGGRSITEETSSSPTMQFLASVDPKKLALVQTAIALVGDDLAAIGPRHQGAEPQTLAVENRVTCDRRAARAIEYG